jgi:hypothetical protein
VNLDTLIRHRGARTESLRDDHPHPRRPARRVGVHRRPRWWLEQVVLSGVAGPQPRLEASTAAGYWPRCSSWQRRANAAQGSGEDGPDIRLAVKKQARRCNGSPGRADSGPDTT